MKQNIKNKFCEIRVDLLVLLLAIWMLIPVFKDLKLTSAFTFRYEYIYMMIVGVIGGIFLILDIYNNFEKKEYKKEILPIIFFTIFMIWTLVSTVCSPNVNTALYGTAYRREGYITYLTYAGFFSCAFLVKSKENRRELVNMFVVSALLNIIIVLLYNKGIGTGVFNRRNLGVTSFYHFNHYGYYLLLATVSANFLFITEKNKIMKIWYLILYSFLLYYLIINDTFGCYLALIVTLILYTIYCIYHKKNRSLAILSIIIFILMSLLNKQTRRITQTNVEDMFVDIKKIINVIQVNHNEKDETNNTITNQKMTNNKKKEITIATTNKKANVTKTQELTNVTTNKKMNNTNIKEENNKAKDEVLSLAEKAGTGRLDLWINGIKFFLERPILGYGPDNLGAKYKEVEIREEDRNQDRPHNLLIQLATTSGIIGLVTYVSAIGIILIRALKRMKMEDDVHVISFFVVIAYLISAMFGNSMYYTSPYFFIFLGLLMSENIIRIKNK